MDDKLLAEIRKTLKGAQFGYDAPTSRQYYQHVKALMDERDTLLYLVESLKQAQRGLAVQETTVETTQPTQGLRGHALPPQVSEQGSVGSGPRVERPDLVPGETHTSPRAAGS